MEQKTEFLKEEPDVSAQTNKVFYWHGILDPGNLSALYGDIIEKLVDGNYVGLNLEKLAGHSVYSVRINNSDRLLFTTITVKNQPYLMLLDEVLNHDYAKSRFLKPSVLKHYLELHGRVISEKLVNEHFKKIEEAICFLPEKTKKKPSIEYLRIDYCNQKFIELSELQRNIATKMALPLILSGVPGSGKSCIALLILGQYVESNIDNEYPILYVTESEQLASSMQKAWQALPVAQNLASDDVQFKSYQQLISDLDIIKKDIMFVGKDYYMTWLTHYISQKKTAVMRKTSVFNDSFFDDLDVIYQEFRIISGCCSISEYKALGQRQSVFHNKAEQNWLYDACGLYMKYLLQEGRIHAPFYPLAMKNKYKCIVVDEAQDFSHRQLKILFNLAENAQICYCEDSRQSLSDNKSKITFLKGLLYTVGKEDNFMTLLESHRCPLAVITLVNALSELKAMVTGHGQPDIMAAHEKTEAGLVTWITSLEGDALAALQYAASFPDFAVITIERYKDEIKKILNTPHVFAIKEIKGLEYKNIFVYQLFDDPLFRAADKLIGEQSSQFSKKSGNRAKKDQGNEQFGPAFSLAYTAFTRTTHRLYIFQKPDPRLHNITTKLTGVIAQKQTSLNTSPTIEPSLKNNKAEWFNQVKIQLEMGNNVAARDIYLEKVNDSVEAFEAFKMMYLADSLPVVAGEKSNKVIFEMKKTNVSIPAQQVTKHNNKSFVKQAHHVPVQPKPVVANNKNSGCSSKQVVPEPILKLQKNINETSLFKFLRDKKAGDYLFKVPLSEGACLFSMFFFDKNSIQALFYCIPTYLKLFAMNMTEDALCRPQVRQNSATSLVRASDNASALYWFLSLREGLDLFAMLLTANPGISKLINAEALCLSLSAAAKENANVSVMYLLSSTTKGRVLFDALLTHNPAFCKLICVETLCLPLTVAANNFANTSALYCLSEVPEGQKILIKLFAGNPRLAESIPYEALSRALGTGAGKYANTSVLYSLTASICGIGILKGLLKNNPQLKLSIRSDILCLPLTSEAGSAMNASPLYWLSTIPYGQGLLIDLLINNAELAGSISAPALTLRCIKAPGKFVNTSPLHGLLSSMEGHNVLLILLKANPGLAKTMGDYILCLDGISDSGEESEILSIFSLYSTPAGQEILEILSVDRRQSSLAKIGLFSGTAVSLHPESSNMQEIQGNSTVIDI